MSRFVSLRRPSDGMDLPGFIRGDSLASTVYRRKRRQLLKEAVLGEGPLVTELLQCRRAALALICNQRWLRESFACMLKNIQSLQLCPSDGVAIWRNLRVGDFVHLRDTLIPILAEQQLLNLPVKGSVIDVVTGLPMLHRFQWQVQQVFSESFLNEPKTPYRTVYHNGCPIIIGHDDCTIGALAGIAHELGHCLYERLMGPTHLSHLSIQAGSECVAHCLEELAVLAYLRQQGREEHAATWFRYQRKVDALNLHFFLIEGAALFGWPAVEPNFFSEAAMVFRESLFTLPGYQVVYAHASLARLNLHPARRG